ncbi:hypothetical protein AB5N19_12501 [Seiridium cardinale]
MKFPSFHDLIPAKLKVRKQLERQLEEGGVLPVSTTQIRQVLPKHEFMAENQYLFPEDSFIIRGLQDVPIQQSAGTGPGSRLYAALVNACREVYTIWMDLRRLAAARKECRRRWDIIPGAKYEAMTVSDLPDRDNTCLVTLVDVEDPHAWRPAQHNGQEVPRFPEGRSIRGKL